MTFEEWYAEVEKMFPVLLWISPKKWHANESIFIINDKVDLEIALTLRRGDKRLEAIPMLPILCHCCPQPSLMSLIWDKKYSLMAGCDDDNIGLVRMRHADPLWEFLTDLDNRNKKFHFIREPDWEDAVTCIME